MQVEFLSPLWGSLFIVCTIPTADAVGYNHRLPEVFYR
jgi:hypothetical protein